MCKELKCSLVNFLNFADENSEAQIPKEYSQIYTKMMTNFGRASNHFIVLLSCLVKSPYLLYFFAQKQQSVMITYRYLK